MKAVRVFAFLFCLYQAWAWWLHPNHYGVLEWAILPFHEAGHFAMAIFGNELLTVAGGTLVQVGLPLAFAIYFAAVRKDYFAAFFAAFWMCETLQNVSWYMRDARLMLLPLLGGDDTIHDWNYLLGHFGVLPRAESLAWQVRALGGLGMGVTLIGQAFVLASPYWPRSEEEQAPSDGQAAPAQV